MDKINISDFPLPSEILDYGEIDGVVWVAARAPRYNAVNGYVKLPDQHPWYSYEDPFDIYTDVPWGGVTYHEGKWFGFDTLHAGQYWPDELKFHKPFSDDTLMTEALTIDYTKQFAKEAAAHISGGTYII